MTDEMRWLESFTAAFEPTRRDDLKPGAEAFIGRVIEWQPVWVVEDGPYAGEWACAPICPESVPFGWVPESDLRRDTEDQPVLDTRPGLVA